MMCGADKTVTVWNKWHNPDTRKDEWHRHVILRCCWDTEIKTAIIGTGAVVSSTYSVLIEENPAYRDKRTWDNLSAEDKAVCFTLTPGDLMALGEVEREITGIAPDTETKVKSDHAPDAFTIKAVVDRSAGYMSGRHYEVSGV